jgi:hypothetical protein
MSLQWTTNLLKFEIRYYASYLNQEDPIMHIEEQGLK